uniref:Fungal-type protein kinase domain-containing protein n=1 Tax=Moniliophthora roreri TaxID=221103 RepID=A0A0W0FIQ0_MONRR
MLPNDSGSSLGSHLVVTDILDLEGNAWDVVHFFAALERSSDEVFGFDRSVKRFYDRTTQIVHYRYTVGNKIYQTTRINNTHKAHNLLGRATRIWELREALFHPTSRLDTSLEVKFLCSKIFKIPEDAPTEKEILEGIRDKIDKIIACERVPIRSDEDLLQDTVDNSTNFLREMIPASPPIMFALRLSKNVPAETPSAPISGSTYAKPYGAVPGPSVAGPL